jgi:electron transport complex protein RnfC
VIPTKYPSGGAKQLTQILTGKQVPHGGRSSDIGVLMHRHRLCGKRAVIDGEPLTERVVTDRRSGLVRATSGRASALRSPSAQRCRFLPSADPGIMGGPLMGFTLPWLDVPVVKITNCLLAPSASEMGEPKKKKAAFAAAPARTPVRPICCRSSCTGSAKASSTTKPPAPGGLHRMRRLRLVCQQYSAGAVLPSGKSGDYACSGRKTRGGGERALRPDRRAWSAAARVWNGISKPRFSLPPKIRTRLTPPCPGTRKQRDAAQPIVLSGAKPDNSAQATRPQAREAEARARKSSATGTKQRRQA